ncbi:MAG TPA: hypothetical protein VN604_11840 [Nitrospirota bacterium]|nr:hypothetical protein [Nitrospirota bacterium]
MKNPDLRSQAVMNVDKGESIAGLWATPQIPQIGVYKLAVKKRKDGMFEWVHFQHRPDGTRKVLFRGEVESVERVSVVLDAANKTLGRVYGVAMSVADADMTTLDGRKADGKVH